MNRPVGALRQSRGSCCKVMTEAPSGSAASASVSAVMSPCLFIQTKPIHSVRASTGVASASGTQFFASPPGRSPARKSSAAMIGSRCGIHEPSPRASGAAGEIRNSAAAASVSPACGRARPAIRA